jgi:hypothetical protein
MTSSRRLAAQAKKSGRGQMKRSSPGSRPEAEALGPAFDRLLHPPLAGLDDADGGGRVPLDRAGDLAGEAARVVGIVEPDVVDLSSPPRAAPRRSGASPTGSGRSWPCGGGRRSSPPPPPSAARGHRPCRCPRSEARSWVSWSPRMGMRSMARELDGWRRGWMQPLDQRPWRKRRFNPLEVSSGSSAISNNLGANAANATPG